MKNLLLMRHAKSSWGTDSLPDHQRPLNQRGKRDAPRMGNFVREQGIFVDAILCSTALRARQTAEGFLQEYTFEGEVAFFDDLYHAGVETIISVLTRVPDDISTAMVIAHNPGLDDFLETACNEYEHMSTASIAYVRFQVEAWSALRAVTRGNIVHFWKPREI